MTLNARCLLAAAALALLPSCARTRTAAIDDAAVLFLKPAGRPAVRSADASAGPRDRPIRQVQHTDGETAPPPAPLPADASETESIPPATGGLLPPGLTLLDLEQLALANNPTLIQAQARVMASRGRWTQVGLKPNPVVGYQGTEIGNEGEAGQQGGFVSQEFVTADKLELNRAAASHEVAQSRHVGEAQQLRVLTAVRQAFYDVLIAQRTVEVAEQMEEIADKTVDVAQQLLDAEQASRVDLLQAQIEANNADIQLQTARNRHAAAWTQLLAVAGLPPQPPQSLSGSSEADLQAISFDEALARLIAASPELAAARANVCRAQFALQRAEVEPIPNVEVQAGVQKDYATRDTIASIQVGIALPVHDRNQGNICAARAELVAAQREVDRLTLDLETRLAAVMERYMNAGYQVEQYSGTALPAARESRELVEEAYRQQEFDYLRLLTAQRTYFEINLRYLAALRDWWSARLELDGLLLSDGLQNPGIAASAFDAR